MQSKRYAVTGGIGSGKSTVCAILAKKGYPVFSCDEISRELWQDGAYRRALARLFPACTKGGEVEKKALAAYVFADPRRLARLNAYTHPIIMEELLRRMEGHAVSFAEVPLLFEAGFETRFDGVIAVRREEALRLDAAAARDGASREEIRLRMRSQFDPAQYEEKNCLIAENNGTQEELERCVDRLLATLGVPAPCGRGA